jgi:RNA polymerase sigma-70 factor (ECF subfamily)
VALLSTLPIDQAEAVMLRAVIGLDAVAAAKVLGKRPGAVRMAAHRGLHRLAERLRAGAPAPPGGAHNE